MKLSLRYCQCCRSRALTPKSRNHSGMRPGYVYRRGHDLCGRCFREARAQAVRLSRAGSGRLGPRRTDRHPSPSGPVGGEAA